MQARPPAHRGQPASQLASKWENGSHSDYAFGLQAGIYKYLKNSGLKTDGHEENKGKTSTSSCSFELFYFKCFSALQFPFWCSVSYSQAQGDVEQMCVLIGSYLLNEEGEEWIVSKNIS